MNMDVYVCGNVDVDLCRSGLTYRCTCRCRDDVDVDAYLDVDVHIDVKVDVDVAVGDVAAEVHVGNDVHAYLRIKHCCSGQGFGTSILGGPGAPR